MSKERLFLDTVFIQALYNSRDQYHAKALALLPQVEAAAEVWITEAVLTQHYSIEPYSFMPLGLTRPGV